MVAGVRGPCGSPAALPSPAADRRRARSPPRADASQDAVAAGGGGGGGGGVDTSTPATAAATMAASATSTRRNSWSGDWAKHVKAVREASSTAGAGGDGGQFEQLNALSQVGPGLFVGVCFSHDVGESSATLPAHSDREAAAASGAASGGGSGAGSGAGSHLHHPTEGTVRMFVERLSAELRDGSSLFEPLMAPTAPFEFSAAQSLRAGPLGGHQARHAAWAAGRAPHPHPSATPAAQGVCHSSTQSLQSLQSLQSRSGAGAGGPSHTELLLAALGSVAARIPGVRTAYSEV